MHALNGNVRPGRQPDGWTPVGGRLDGRVLNEAQQVGRLRASGWTIPSTIADTYMLRVYDTRLEPTYLRELAQDVAPIDLDTKIIGGDFLTKPDMEDCTAFRPPPLRRWGPEGREAYHLFIPPRPHLQHWLQRCHHQLSVEAMGTSFSVCSVVQRSACPPTFDVPSLRRLLPQAEPLFLDPTLIIKVLAVGQRPPIQRIPASEMKLPPAQWEAALLPRSNVLLILQFHRHSGPQVLPTGEWFRGTPPAPPPSDLELLRMELVLPPATRISSAERFAHRSLEKIAQAMQVPSPSPHQLRQLQVDKGVLYGLFSVPRHLALQWLRGSGCGGCYLRPFWTERTSPAVGRDKFQLLWVKAPLSQGPALWDAVRHLDTVAGLRLGDKDVAIRASATITPEEEGDILTQVQFVLKNQQAQLRRATPGQKWWRLGPLTEAETWHMADLVRSTGLTPVNDQLRVGKMGPFRFCVYFAATGEPLRRSLDDGSWEASSARLEPANPPPRRSATSASVPSLPPEAVWGRRQAPAPAPTNSPPRQSPHRQSVDVSSAAFPPLPAAAPRPPPAAPAARRARRGGSGAPPASPPRMVSPHRNETLDMLPGQTAFFNATNQHNRYLGEEPSEEPAQGRPPVTLAPAPPQCPSRSTALRGQIGPLACYYGAVPEAE